MLPGQVAEAGNTLTPTPTLTLTPTPILTLILFSDEDASLSNGDLRDIITKAATVCLRIRIRTRTLTPLRISGPKVLDENRDSHITVPEVASGFPSTCEFVPRLKYLAKQLLRIKRTFLSLTPNPNPLTPQHPNTTLTP